MTLPPLPPLPPLPGVPQLPLPFPVSGTNAFPEPTIAEEREITIAASILPPLPALPLSAAERAERIAAAQALASITGRRVYSQGYRVTDWFPMRVTPCEDRKGEYEVRFDNAPESLEYWDGKRWPTLAGNFHATGWRGVADNPATKEPKQ